MDQRLNVNAQTIPNETCECGSIYWQLVYVLKKVPAILIGQPKPTMLPVQIYICNSCGKDHPDMEQFTKVISTNGK